MSWSWVVRMLVLLVVVLLVIAGTVVALRLTDPGTEESVEATATPQESAQAQPSPPAIVSPTPTLAPPPPTPVPTAPPAPTAAPEVTPEPALAAGDPCTSEISAAIAAANESQSALMRGELEAAQLSATWGEMAARAQSSAASLLEKRTDAYSVARITAVAPVVSTCTVQSAAAENEVVVTTAEVWTYDAVLSCAATEDEQASREVVRYPAQEYTFARADGAWQMRDWILGAVNIETPWQCT